ncbi:MAG: MBOAT family protein [Planctomycetes bacterium]|nr:MBOAT family protein [Planctomycetota bacterium]
MIFASLLFLFAFLPLFLAGYYALPWIGARNLFLTLASYGFYAWSIPKYVPLMLVSTAIDWFVALRIEAAPDPRVRRRWLVVSMVTNLALLGWFKYANLGVELLRDLTGQPFAGWVAIVLPVGISFYTFQSMSYTIDVYRNEVKPVRSFLDLACYVSMFPQLVAGPIVRYHDVQLQVRDRAHAVAPFARGIVHLALGLAKKVLIADNAALLVDETFASAVPGSGVEPGLLDAWLATLAYSIQIYFDFSGYSDMAIGLGLMTGFRFPSNFLSPYRSESITEFWRRWHVSLSTWLRDYLYVPLGGNRHGSLRTYVNLSLTMLLGGLWHGAAYNFVLWGAYQGAWLVVERLAGKRPLWHFLPHPLRVFVTMLVVLGGWVLFRASSLGTIGSMGKGMLGLNGLGALPIPTGHPLEAWLAVVLGLGIAWTMPRTETLAARF